MTATPRPALARHHRTWLALGQRLAPPADRADWYRTWYAELCYINSQRLTAGSHRLLSGMLHDALWLRIEGWRRAFSGTPLLCLFVLSALAVTAAVPFVMSCGTLRSFTALCGAASTRFFVESTLTVLVGYATSSRSIEQPAVSLEGRVRAQGFFAAKLCLILLLTFLLSRDLCHPLQASAPFTAALLQSLAFVFMALLGLRWTFHDSERRCKHCLRSLAEPRRVGRPSYNFLEWNGTELLCTQGHGSLSVPEIETSWCQSSRWLARHVN